MRLGSAGGGKAVLVFCVCWQAICVKWKVAACQYNPPVFVVCNVKPHSQLFSSVNKVGGCLEPAMNDLNTSLICSPIHRRDAGVTVNTLAVDFIIIPPAIIGHCALILNVY